MANTSNQQTGGASYQSPVINPYQILSNQGQTGFLTNSLLPTAGSAMATGQDIFNQGVGGVNQAATSLANYANQGQNLLGQTGATNLQTGSQGLQSLFNPGYVQQQMDAASIPAQLQYQQNLAGQQANYGGAGEIGSARQAIAGGALAQQNQQQQQAARASMASQIAQNQMSAANSLMGGGAGQLASGLNFGQAGVGAAGAPMNLATQYGQFLNGFNNLGQANFSGTNGMNTTTGQNVTGGGISVLPSLSDVHAKENIEYVGRRNGYKLYDFNYKGRPERYRGVMAQDIRRVNPEAVTVGSDGYLRVDYSQLGFSMEQLGK
jgi:hypothetical protein